MGLRVQINTLEPPFTIRLGDKHFIHQIEKNVNWGRLKNETKLLLRLQKQYILFKLNQMIFYFIPFYVYILYLFYGT